MLCKAGFKMCQAAHVGLVGTENRLAQQLYFAPSALIL